MGSHGILAAKGDMQTSTKGVNCTTDIADVTGFFNGRSHELGWITYASDPSHVGNLSGIGDHPQQKKHSKLWPRMQWPTCVWWHVNGDKLKAPPPFFGQTLQIHCQKMLPMKSPFIVGQIPTYNGRIHLVMVWWNVNFGEWNSHLLLLKSTNLDECPTI